MPFAICIPLIVGAKTLGVLNVNRDLAPDDDALAYLRVLAYEAAFSVERASLYEDLQQFTQNARVHAAATRVTVKLKEDEAYLEIVVQDNGHGFAEPWGDMTVRPGHFGLLGMRERIALLGGVCKISSTPGEGTTIRITVPRDRLI
ncbi:MAG TPA: ATP-binding protein [Candidatus Saccharimonadales bacterium]|nr:ATP-binding protein [Candidatus Saccharimonadales bacterium]